jgi:hypothetical protein
MRNVIVAVEARPDYCVWIRFMDGTAESTPPRFTDPGCQALTFIMLCIAAYCMHARVHHH